MAPHSSNTQQLYVQYAKRMQKHSNTLMHVMKTKKHGKTDTNTHTNLQQAQGRPSTEITYKYSNGGREHA